MIRWLLALLLLTFAPADAPAALKDEGKRIALTFDDVPRRPGAFLTPEQRTQGILSGLADAGVEQAAFFVATGNLSQPYGKDGEARIMMYSAGGNVIANHSHGHVRLSTVPAADYIADIDRAAAWLRNRPNIRPWFRYPFLDEGGPDAAKRDSVRAALRARGLRNGYVTADSWDWYLEQLTLDAKARDKPMDMRALGEIYAETIVDAAEHADKLARAALGRSPVHVMLLHETDLAALYIDKAVDALKAKGWKIVTADYAFADPIAADEPGTLHLEEGRVAALAVVRGRPAAETLNPAANAAYLDRLFAERVLKETPTP